MDNREDTEQEALGSLFEGLKKPERNKLLQAMKLLTLVILFAFALLVTVAAFFFWDYFRKQPAVLAPDKNSFVAPATLPYLILSGLGLLTLVSGVAFLLRRKPAVAICILVVGDLICFILSARI